MQPLRRSSLLVGSKRMQLSLSCAPPWSSSRSSIIMPLSFEHFVGACEQRWWHVEAERFGGLAVDNQFELGWGLHRQLTRLGTFENAIDIARRTIKQIVDIDSVRNQALPFHHETIWIDGRDTVARCESDDQLVMSHRENVGK